MYKSLCGDIYILSFFFGKSVGVERPDLMIDGCLTFQETAELFHSDCPISQFFASSSTLGKSVFIILAFLIDVEGISLWF